MPDPDVQAGDVAAGQTQLRPIMHAGQPLVSIIVVTFNGAEHIKSCLAAIGRQLSLRRRTCLALGHDSPPMPSAQWYQILAPSSRHADYRA
jgi:hypothetical protein